jgi:hypothetical protein
MSADGEPPKQNLRQSVSSAVDLSSPHREVTSQAPHFERKSRLAGNRFCDCPPGIATMLQRGTFFANFPLTESGLPVSSAEGASQNHEAPLMLRTSRYPPIRARGPGVSLPARSETALRSHPAPLNGQEPGGNIGRSRRSSEATPPERGPKTAHPAERWQRICCSGGLWHALPGCRPGGRPSGRVASLNARLLSAMPAASERATPDK